MGCHTCSLQRMRVFDGKAPVLKIRSTRRSGRQQLGVGLDESGIRLSGMAQAQRMGGGLAVQRLLLMHDGKHRWRGLEGACVWHDATHT